MLGVQQRQQQQRRQHRVAQQVQQWLQEQVLAVLLLGCIHSSGSCSSNSSYGARKTLEG
jgi:hypothetical protein